MSTSPADVFINCPFDDDFAPAFRALVFAVTRCGFRVRCAKEADDGTETRIEKLYRIIEQSRYGIHDLSRTELDAVNKLPRFNMPLELGIFLASKRFGSGEQKQKQCVIFDVSPYRYQMFISDIAGMDVAAHGGNTRTIVRKARDWLATASRRKSIPTIATVLRSYDRFEAALPAMAAEAGAEDVEELIFADFQRLVNGWVKAELGLE